MVAKPIIDLIVVIPVGGFNVVKERLVRPGYFHEGGLGIPGREAFDVEDRDLKWQLHDHHLHVCEEGADQLRRHVVYREFMRAQPESRARLSQHRWELCELHDNDRQRCMEGKHAMYSEINALVLTKGIDR